MPRIITRNIWMLSSVSLLTDVASEMLYPVMPVYLRSIGFSVVFIGVLEGIAEAVAGLSKGYFGKWSDERGRRLPFVQAGYALSALAKPALALMTAPLWVFMARTLDRFGKGIRTGARDALLSEETTPEYKARVFGFHRSMDTLGAAIGPLLALLFLSVYPGDYGALFLWAALPGLLAILLTLLIKEKRRAIGRTTAKRPGFLNFMRYWKEGGPQYRRLVGALLVFALVNSSDVFLLLRMKESGVSDRLMIGVYVFYNLVYALAAYPLGLLADKLGMKPVLVGGLVVFAAVYAGMGVADSKALFFALFFLYGLYAAATEGIAKAWITNLCRNQNAATAIGTFTAFQSIAALAASTLTGFLWMYASATVAFMITAVVSICVAVYLSRQ